MSRPKKENPKRIQIGLRVTDADLAHVEDVADAIPYVGRAAVIRAALRLGLSDLDRAKSDPRELMSLLERVDDPSG